MKIHLHIERLVLEGVPVSASERPLLQTAMETELTQLLLHGGLSDELRSGAALSQVRAGVVRVGNEGSPKKLGADIARAVHQGLGHSGRRMSATAGRRLSAENRSSLSGENPR
jgi:hypothetical protein